LLLLQNAVYPSTMSAKVFVAGASGYIGEEVAAAFRRAGYIVYGLIRNATKKNHLLKKEIIPVVGELGDPTKYIKYLESASVIVDAVGINEHSNTLWNAVLEATGNNRSPSQKPLFIYTSGILVYGDQPNRIVDEMTPTNPSPFLIPRKKFEEKVITCERVRGVVVRPGFVYGGGGGNGANNYFGIKPGQDLVLYGKKTKRWNWVHVYDCADAYVKIAQKGCVVDGQIFNVVSWASPTYEEIMLAGARAAGWNGTVKHIEQVPSDNVMLQIFEANVVCNPKKAIEILGWVPQHFGPMEEMDLLYQSWQAHKHDEELLKKIHSQ
jgi:nucleoside-diphosphate-sugar epimerase